MCSDSSSKSSLVQESTGLGNGLGSSPVEKDELSFFRINSAECVGLARESRRASPSLLAHQCILQAHMLRTSHTGTHADK